MDHIHVSSEGIAPCDDPEDQLKSFQLVVKVCLLQGSRHQVERVEEAICCTRLSNSRLQTRCSWSTGRTTRLGRLKNEKMFPSSNVLDCLCFLSVCWQSQFHHNCSVSSMHTSIPTFLVGRYYTPCLSTDEWFFLFPSILVAQVFVGVMGNTLPIWVHGVGDISDVILSCWILCICVWDPDRDFAPLHKDYTSS